MGQAFVIIKERRMELQKIKNGDKSFTIQSEHSRMFLNSIFKSCYHRRNWNFNFLQLASIKELRIDKKCEGIHH